MTFALFSIALLAAVQQAGDPFLSFTRTPATEAVATTVEVGILRTDGRNADYWLKRTQFTNGAQQVTESWTDTDRCPAARAPIRAAVDLAPPQLHVPGVDMTEDGSYRLTLEGVEYELTSRAHYDSNIGSEIRFSSNVGTPLGRWVEATLESLDDCWSDTQPEGYPGPSTLF